jgi:hypothetical protein
LLDAVSQIYSDNQEQNVEWTDFLNVQWARGEYM